MTVYHLTFSHQLEPKDYGYFSSVEKAESFLKGVGVSTSKKKKYGRTVIYDGSYFLKEHHVS